MAFAMRALPPDSLFEALERLHDDPESLARDQQYFDDPHHRTRPERQLNHLAFLTPRREFLRANGDFGETLDTSSRDRPPVRILNGQRVASRLLPDPTPLSA